MIASSLTCRVLRAVWLWLAALGQSSRVFAAIGRCYRATGTHRTLTRWLSAGPARWHPHAIRAPLQTKIAA